MRPFPPRLWSWPVARASSLPSGRGSHRRGRKRAGPGRRQREHDARAGWPHPAALGLATGDQGRARLAATPSARALAAGFADRTLGTSYREPHHRKEHGRALRGDGEDVAIGRKEQDELALESHHRAIAARSGASSTTSSLSIPSSATASRAATRRSKSSPDCHRCSIAPAARAR